jgi:hypothetical protein
MKRVALAALAVLLAAPAPALAWGYEGHRIVATIARSYLTPDVARQVDALLAADTDTLAAHNMIEAATWADTYRNSHRETSDWHFVDLELSGPDEKAACFGFPAPSRPASAGPEHDCLIDRTNAFLAELKDRATPTPERIIALKFVLHFVGDLHQPLHAADNHDRGGNCVRLSLGGARTTNLHSFWDTGLVTELGADPQAVAADLGAQITPKDRRAWEAGTPETWARESYETAKRSVYGIGSSAVVVADQLKRAGVRLAYVLNAALAR